MIRPYLIAGPCAAETEQQVLATAQGIARCQLAYPNYSYIFRAGIWKPRTSPDTFQGIGAEGLQWMKRVKAEYGLAVATEVATAQQLQLVVEAGLDYIWIGARTAANPIAVQSIADAIVEYCSQKAPHTIKGVLIKNAVNEDAALWIGNISRLEQTGIPVMAVHRGCNHRPCWSMVCQLRQQRPDIPLIIDPSHLAGNANAVTPLCIKAQQLAYQGWMIETHIDPCAALSDAQQQISPSQLERLIQCLMDSVVVDDVTELDWLRCMIDEVDDDLWNILSKRMDICRQIGQWKKQRAVPVIQPARYQEIIRKRTDWSVQHGISFEAVQQIMDAIHKESIRIQS